MPNWRPMSWAIIIWTVLFGFWIFSGLSSASNNCEGVSAESLSACQAGTALGAGLGITFIVGVWFVGFVVLSLIWFMRRK